MAATDKEMQNMVIEENEWAKLREVIKVLEISREVFINIFKDLVLFYLSFFIFLYIFFTSILINVQKNYSAKVSNNIFRNSGVQFFD